MPLLDIDPITGAVEHMQYDHNAKRLLITRQSDISSVLDANQQSYNDGSESWRGDNNDMWHVGRVPMDVLYIWLQEFNQVRSVDAQVKSPLLPHKEWQDFLWLRLNSSDYYKFKTAPVHV